MVLRFPPKKTLQIHCLSGAQQSLDEAGQIRFGHNKNNRGQIKYWNNASGHYKPLADLAGDACLPLDLFR